MAPARDRVGQIVAGTYVVLADHRRTRRGRVLWHCRHLFTGADKYLTTEKLIRLDREHGARPERQQ